MRVYLYTFKRRDGTLIQVWAATVEAGRRAVCKLGWKPGEFEKENEVDDTGKYTEHRISTEARLSSERRLRDVPPVERRKQQRPQVA